VPDQLSLGYLEEKPDVVVLVKRFRSSRGNIVHIEIEDLTRAGAGNRREIAKPRLFFRLAQRRSQDIRLPVGVATELQPTIEFAVMSEHHGPTFSRNDPGLGGNVAGKTIPEKTTLDVIQQRPNPIDRDEFIRMATLVSVEQGVEIHAIHRAKLAARSARPQNESPKPAEKLKPSSENPKSARKRAARSIVARALTP